MPRYRVLDTHIYHDGEQYAPGDTISLTEEQALLVAVEPLPEAEQEPGKGRSRK